MTTEDDNIFEATYNLLRNRSAQLMLKQIAADTSIKYSWLCAFHQGRLKGEYNTSKDTIFKLNKYLVSKLNPTLTWE